MNRAAIRVVACAWACVCAAAAPVHADVLILRSGHTTREMRCVILEETGDAYKVRIKLGKSTVPKARVVGVQRQTADENGALIAEWDAPPTRRGGAARRHPAPDTDGPIPAPDRSETRRLDVNALMQTYTMAQLQAGFEYDMICPGESPWCVARVAGVGKLHARELGLRRGDYLLGINGSRIPRGAAADQFVAAAMQRAISGQRSTVHLMRAGKRLDIRYAP